MSSERGFASQHPADAKRLSAALGAGFEVRGRSGRLFVSVEHAQGGDTPDSPMDAVRLRFGSYAAAVYSFEMTPDAQGRQIRGFVAAAS